MRRGEKVRRDLNEQSEKGKEVRVRKHDGRQ